MFCKVVVGANEDKKLNREGVRLARVLATCPRSAFRETQLVQPLSRPLQSSMERFSKWRVSLA